MRAQGSQCKAREDEEWQYSLMRGEMASPQVLSEVGMGLALSSSLNLQVLFLGREVSKQKGFWMPSLAGLAKRGSRSLPNHGRGHVGKGGGSSTGREGSGIGQAAASKG